MHLEFIDNTAAFAALHQEWNDLVARSSSGFVTLTWEWMYTWWEVYGESRRLQLVLVWDGDRLVGLAPLQSRLAREFGISIRRLEFLASGEIEADETCSDYLDLIVERGRESEVVGALWQYILGRLEWDEFSAVSILVDSSCLAVLRTCIRTSSCVYQESERSRCVTVPLTSDWEELMDTLSSKMRAQIRRHRRLLAEHGAVVFRRLGSPEEIAQALPQFIELHQRWWISRGKPGCFTSKKFTQFHTLLSKRLGKHDMLNLHLLTVNNRLIAARYSFNWGRRVFEYQTGVDPHFDDTRIGLGVQCTAFCIEDAIRRGCTEYDFGEGLQDYKLSWSDQLRTTVNVRIVKPSVREQVLRVLHRARTDVHYIKQRLGR
jgi:CelD/BcsL family acetyltransferase involved in cellulose biosynthesis